MVPSILCLSVLLSLCVSSLAPPVQMSDSWSRKQMCWVIWAQHPGPLIPPVYPPTSCANRPQNQTAVSNLLQSVHPLPCFLLPPCRPLVCKSPKPGSCNAELLGRGRGQAGAGGGYRPRVWMMVAEKVEMTKLMHRSKCWLFQGFLGF